MEEKPNGTQEIVTIVEEDTESLAQNLHKTTMSYGESNTVLATDVNPGGKPCNKEVI